MLDLTAACELIQNIIFKSSSSSSSLSSFATLPTTAVIIKHGNPCGTAQAADPLMAITLAYQADAVSAYGGILAISTVLDESIFEIIQDKFLEVIIAPKISDGLIQRLTAISESKNKDQHKDQHKDQRKGKFKNLRLIESSFESLASSLEGRILSGGGGVLLQENDRSTNNLYKELNIVNRSSLAQTVNFSSPQMLSLITFGLATVYQCKSNAIVVVANYYDRAENKAKNEAKNKAEKQNACYLLGHGQGQTNRVTATKLAVAELNKFPKQIIDEAILISDGFFPFADNIEIANAAGIKNIVSPGGSIHDREVVKRCNELDISMIFTGVRLFKH